MTYTPRHVVPPDPVFLSTWTFNSLGGVIKSHATTSLASGTYAAADRIFYYPFYTSRGYSLARWFWLNGATVGTNYIQTAIYDENLNLFKASPRTLSAGTVNQVQYASPGIHGTNVTTGSDSTDATTYTTASVTLKAGVMYLLTVENSHGSSATAVSSVTGGAGLPTFTSRSTIQFNGNLNRVSIWSAAPTADYTGTLTVNFGGTTQTGSCHGLNAFYHVDTATNDGIVQNATGTGNSTTPLATLAAFASGNNATFGSFGIGAGLVRAPVTGYVELTEVQTATPAQSLHDEYRPDNDTTVDETITSNPWGACAVEIKSLGTGAIAIPPMRGYLAIHCNGTTATIFRRSADLSMQPWTYLQSSASTGFPQSATLAADSGTVYVCGFTSRSSP